MLIVDDDTGEYDKNRGSYRNGKPLVRLSVGITVVVLLFWPSTNGSVMASQIEQHRDVMALGRNVSIKNRKPSGLGL